VEFVSYDEAMEVLGELGVLEAIATDDRLQLELADSDDVVHLHIASAQDESGRAASLESARAGAEQVIVASERMPDIIEHLIHKLGLKQVLLVPIGKWGRVFDAVAFSMAENEHWQEIDSTASMSLNTRDPLLCEPGDIHTVRDLVAAILSDAESPDQGIMITSTNSPVMVELHPDGSARISVGNPVLADEIIKTFSADSTSG